MILLPRVVGLEIIVVMIVYQEILIFPSAVTEGERKKRKNIYTIYIAICMLV